MARNVSGVYSLPAGSVASNGDTSDATDINTPFADIAADLNVPRPVVAGGTGATTASAARTGLGLGPAATKSVTGADAAAVTGTAGTDGNLVEWNADGDAVGSSVPSSSVATLTGAQTLTNKTLTSPTLTSPKINVGADAAGDMYRRKADGTLERLPVGTADQVLTMVGGVPTWADAGGGATQSAVVATTSGTAFDFTSLPAGLNYIRAIINKARTIGTDELLIQLGTGGALKTSGYAAEARIAGNMYDSTAGFNMKCANSTLADMASIYEFRRVPATDTWIGHLGGASTYLTSINDTVTGGGIVTLSGEMDTLRLTRSGSDTFDAGSFFIEYG